MLKNYLDDSRRKYDEICKKRSEAGKKGRAKAAASYYGKSSHDSICSQLQAKTETEIKTETENKTKTENKTETENKTLTEKGECIITDGTAVPSCPTHTHTGKTAHGEFLNVYLSDGEFSALNGKYGDRLTQKAIGLLSATMARESGTRYTNENHYATIISWVIDAVKEREFRQKRGSVSSGSDGDGKKCFTGFDNLDFDDFFED